LYIEKGKIYIEKGKHPKDSYQYNKLHNLTAAKQNSPTEIVTTPMTKKQFKRLLYIYHLIL